MDTIDIDKDYRVALRFIVGCILVWLLHFIHDLPSSRSTALIILIAAYAFGFIWPGVFVFIGSVFAWLMSNGQYEGRTIPLWWLIAWLSTLAWLWMLD